jgi:hypothetical protein
MEQHSSPPPVKLVFNMFLFLTMFFYLDLMVKAPLISQWLPTLFMVLGLPLLFLGFSRYGSYHNVYDHEPTNLFNRPTTGKQARFWLSNIGYCGVGLLITGIILWYWNCVFSRQCPGPWDLMG